MTFKTDPIPFTLTSLGSSRFVIDASAFAHLSHLASIEEILHHQQVQLLLRVVLRVLVSDPVNSQDLRQRRGPLRRRNTFVILLNSAT